jgi:hypothetical protein
VFHDAVGYTFNSEPKRRCRYTPYGKPLPFSLMIGTAYGCIAPDCGKGKNRLSKADLPNELLIDYVHVYQKKGVNAAKIYSEKEIKKSENVTDFNSVSASYYPHCLYKWSSEELEVRADEKNTEYAKFRPKADTEPNQLCTINCEITFPSGYVEKLQQIIKIIP